MSGKEFDRLLKSWEPRLVKYGEHLSARQSKRFFGHSGEAILKQMDQFKDELQSQENRKLNREIDKLMLQIAKYYLTADVKQRHTIIKLVSQQSILEYLDSFPGSQVSLLEGAKKAENLKTILCVVSIQNGRSRDKRDVYASLDELRKAAENVGIDSKRFFKEIAGLSDRGARDILLRYGE